MSVCFSWKERQWVSEGEKETEKREREKRQMRECVCERERETGRKIDRMGE